MSELGLVYAIREWGVWLRENAEIFVGFKVLSPCSPTHECSIIFNNFKYRFPRKGEDGIVIWKLLGVCTCFIVFLIPYGAGLYDICIHAFPFSGPFAKWHIESELLPAFDIALKGKYVCDMAWVWYTLLLFFVMKTPECS